MVLARGCEEYNGGQSVPLKTTSLHLPMPLGIHPTVDFAFKLILGSPAHTAITIHFLWALLGIRIKKVEILNPILGPELDEDKLSILDIRATDEHGRQFNIEMQTSLTAGLVKRLVYYAGSLYVRQIGSGESYLNLRPAITICVLDQRLFPHDRLHCGFFLRDQAGDLLCDDLQVHTIELPKSRVTEHNVKNASPLEKWVFLLQRAADYSPDELRELLPEPELQEAIGVLEMIAKTPDQRDLYEARLKMQRDEAARIEYAKTEGRTEGRSEGELIGQIRTLESLLGIPVSTDQEIAANSQDQLRARAAELQTKLRSRLGN